MNQLSPFVVDNNPHLKTFNSPPWARENSEDCEFEYLYLRNKLVSHLSFTSAERSTGITIRVLDDVDHRQVGLIGLADVDRKRGTAIIDRIDCALSRGALVLKKNLVRKALDIGFDMLGLNRIDLRVYSNDLKSIRLFDKLGFFITAILEVSMEFYNNSRYLIWLSRFNDRYEQFADSSYQ